MSNNNKATLSIWKNLTEYNSAFSLVMTVFAVLLYISSILVFSDTLQLTTNQLESSVLRNLLFTMLSVAFFVALAIVITSWKFLSPDKLMQFSIYAFVVFQICFSLALFVMYFGSNMNVGFDSFNDFFNEPGRAPWLFNWTTSLLVAVSFFTLIIGLVFAIRFLFHRRERASEDSKVETLVDSLEMQLTAVKNRLEDSDRKLQEINSKSIEIKNTSGKIDTLLDQANSRFQSQIDKLNTRINELSDKSSSEL